MCYIKTVITFLWLCIAWPVGQFLLSKLKIKIIFPCNHLQLTRACTHVFMPMMYFMMCMCIWKCMRHAKPWLTFEKQTWRHPFSSIPFLCLLSIFVAISNLLRNTALFTKQMGAWKLNMRISAFYENDRLNELLNCICSECKTIQTDTNIEKPL